MANNYNTVAEIDASTENWKICVRVVRLWLVPDFKNKKLPHSLEMVLVDSHGDRIHATVKRTLVYKFQNEIKEGKCYSFHMMGVATNIGSFRTNHHPYKLTFQFTTKVILLADGAVPNTVYDLVPISTIMDDGLDFDFLVNVMGLLTGVGTERENEKDGKKTKMNVIQLEDEGVRIECTLFGEYVDELNAFLASGEGANTVVIVQFAKMNSFQNKIHIQNCMICTKLIFNSQCQQAMQLTQRMITSMDSPSQGLTHLTETPKMDASEEFLKATGRKTIMELKDCKEVKSSCVLGTIKHILEDDDWWYTACSCGRKVYADSNMFFCNTCNKHTTKVALRYKIKVRVIDETDSTTFVIFDRDGTMLLNKTCAELFDISQKVICLFLNCVDLVYTKLCDILLIKM